jgi:ABC-type branched-subunit amino acid transport system substrate-binding protein
MNIRGFGKICNLNKIDVLITDDGIDVETKMRLEEIGINVVIGHCSSVSLVQASQYAELIRIKIKIYCLSSMF